MKIWLDDIRTAPEGWVWVKYAKEALELLKQGNIEAISLDHDLDMVAGEPTPGGLISATYNASYHSGMWLLDQMIALNLWPTRHCLVHSQSELKWAMKEKIRTHFKRKP